MKIYKLACTNKYETIIAILGLYSTEATAIDAVVDKVLSKVLDLRNLFFSNESIEFPQTYNKTTTKEVVDFAFSSGFADYDPDVYTVKIETKQRKIFDGAVRDVVKALTKQDVTINCINEALKNFLQTDLEFRQNGINLNFHLGNYVILNSVFKVMNDYFFNSGWSIEEIEMDEMLPETNIEALKELKNLLQSNEHEEQ